jgi:hypothetical protein
VTFIHSSYELDAYISIDYDVIAAETQTEEEISMKVKEKKQMNRKRRTIMIRGIKMTVLTLSDALEDIRTVNRFYEAKSENTKIISEIVEI